MSDDLLMRLQAMFTSGEILGYICSQIPSGRLESGWVERNLVAKGPGNVPLPVNRQLLILTDRGVRLFTSNMNLSASDTFGMLILGEPSLKSENLVFLVGDIRTSTGTKRLAISVYSDTLSPDKTAAVLFTHGLGLHVNTIAGEPTTDYIEQMREDNMTDIVTAALVIRIPQTKFEPGEWIQNGMRTTEASDEVPLCNGQFNEQLSKFALLVTKWILGLELLKNFKAPTLVLIVRHVNGVNLCLWDGKNRMASFATMDHNDFQSHLVRYIHSLWSALDDNIVSHEVSSSVRPRVHEETPPATTQSLNHELSVSDDARSTMSDSVNTQEMESLLQQVVHQINSIPVTDLSVRISHLEQRIEQITAQVTSDRVSARDKDTDGKTAANQVASSLKVLVDRLEELSQRLSMLEEQVRSVVKDVESTD